jgi:hypothetical protein
MNNLNEPNIMRKTIKSFCKLLGHRWTYKDYSNWIKENGEDYDFKASRNCSRCNQNEYLYKEWKAESKNSAYDIERDSLSLKKIHYYQVQ